MPSLAIGLSKSILSVNPSFLDINIDLILIDEGVRAGLKPAPTSTVFAGMTVGRSLIYFRTLVPEH
jgi:hypothetical protein